MFPYNVEFWLKPQQVAQVLAKGPTEAIGLITRAWDISKYQTQLYNTGIDFVACLVAFLVVELARPSSGEEETVRESCTLCS